MDNRELANKIDGHYAQVDKRLGRIETLLVGSEGAQGLVPRLAVVEERQAAHRWSLRAVWAAAVAAALSAVGQYFSRSP